MCCDIELSAALFCCHACQCLMRTFSNFISSFAGGILWKEGSSRDILAGIFLGPGLTVPIGMTPGVLLQTIPAWQKWQRKVKCDVSLISELIDELAGCAGEEFSLAVALIHFGILYSTGVGLELCPCQHKGVAAMENWSQEKLRVLKVTINIYHCSNKRKSGSFALTLQLRRLGQNLHPVIPRGF